MMLYVIFVIDRDETETLYCAPVPEENAEYLQRVIATLRPLSQEEYITGPAVMLHTFARFSYVLHEKQVLWCVEWDPGFIVVRFAPTGEMAWTAIRSPVPNFGGREATEAEMDAYDEDAHNPQRRLIFDPWDAQFDEQERKWRSFTPARPEVETGFQAALAPVNDPLARLMERYGDQTEAWSRQCKENLASWCGEGLRLN